MRIVVGCITLVFFCADLQAQPATMVERKLSVLARDRATKNVSATFIISTTDLFRLTALVRERPAMRIIKSFDDYGLVYVQAPSLLTDTVFLQDPSVRFVEILRTPKEEKAIDGFDPGTNSIAYTHRKHPAVNGNGMVVSIKERLPDSTDIDFKGRFFSTSVSSKVMSTHASNIGTMIAGAGNSDPLAKGVAWGATITSSDFTYLVPDSHSSYILYDISVQNHSYGTGIENYYGADAAAYDKSVLDKPDLLHVFSAGNSGDQMSPSGNYRNLPAVANLTGSFKMSKNTISVGAIDSFYHVETLSSRGPAHDGRLKPELVAYGHDGSSGAAAIVSGTALLLQQVFKERHNTPLPAALAKAIMVNAADDVGLPGIDFLSGFGSVNTERSVAAILKGKYFSGMVSDGGSEEATINIPAGTAKLKITLSYSDLPAQPNAEKALVNDLDLLVTRKQSGATWRPWVLNSFPHNDSLLQPATRKIDTLNNVEQVSIDFPEAGMYTIRVSGTELSGSQPFSIAYDYLPQNLYWTYPTATNDVISGSTVVLRWASAFSSANALLESTTNGVEWNVENSQLDIAKQYYKWKAPDTAGWVLFRIQYNGEIFFSDTIVVTGLLQPTTGLHCADSVLLTWNEAGVKNYNVYRLGEKYMQEITTTTDTTLMLRDLTKTAYFAIAPVLSSKMEGRRSYAFDYSTQGAGCYVNTFLADNLNGLGQLTVLLGTTFNITSLAIEKWSNMGFTTWKILPTTSTNFKVVDSSLISGMNVYRLKIQLRNHQVIYSANASLLHFMNSEYILFPNPVRNNSTFTLASKDADDVVFKLYHATGALVMEVKVTDNQQLLSTASLSPGIYFYSIGKKGNTPVPGRLIVQ